MLTDPKMLALTNAQFGMWIKLLCFANQQSVRGIISFEKGTFERTFEKVLNSHRKITKSVLQKFKDLGLIEIDLEEGFVSITNWNKRQFASDDVTKRTLKFKERKRSRKRSVEQNRTESLSSDLCSSSVSSFSLDRDDQTTASPVEAMPSKSPPTDKKNAFKEKSKPFWKITEKLVERFIDRNGDQELHDLYEYAKTCKNKCTDEDLNNSLWHTLSYYESDGGLVTATTYFRQELEERSGSLNAVAEAG